ncbi:class I SAM-dependent DNA methyltransferase [Deinococcus metallilatus]|uniref:site-specific DNA-methyltransferase (adenine-specific) n=1 Tax=Deinococcus metallilatus TaxID=1211322 RepID=A0AAJ5F2P5_9DEIO|nr:DNA methyltransferase [Deinococcus metallilatus]MBB5295446.1 hypothetical protein [Deinococcus metallilatus]QBY08032.1 class I SAM-dependent DNA methyltransferase [Deinococcus metallilatus]RXJ12925.1 class I SAM-dependent DNA methyltransferase [Deinococcus metallilatus]TLK27153.1 class I SAM-dependent DNA methyltransferase [Deinococcus metallilatus]GMA16124.1 methylase [Deinococcus metallilatus]
MALSWNDIRARAATFARDWQDETQENAGAQTFWNEFFNVFGVDRKRVAVFEKKVGKVSGVSGRGRIDLLWPGRLLAEHKTRGKDLDAAFTQAQDYFAGLEEHERPAYVVVSDFARIRLYDLEAETHIEFPITEFPQHVERFGFIAGFQQRHFREQDPVNVKAAEQMARLHDQLEKSGYKGHQLELLLVRLLFLLFADDTGLFDQKGIFYDLIEATRKDGTDLGPVLAKLFQVLDTPLDRRQTTLDPRYAAFPYVNGELFRERIDLADFDAGMREHLLGASSLDWGKISPAIFGAMFQGVMDPAERRALGAHYTSEANILKALGPLFLDELKAMREAARGNKDKLQRFLNLLPTLRFLDPACGCGNFLILAYRELRRLELDALAELHRGHTLLNIGEVLKVNVGQFYGIEYEEFPAQIARVAMWLTDHQMNVEASLLLGQPFVNLPLADAAHILHGDALEADWEAHLNLAADADGLTQLYITGNPPFVGSYLMSPEQKRQVLALFDGNNEAGVLDYVTAWYMKSARLMRKIDRTWPHIRVATTLVSTNSIVQGEQVPPLWTEILENYGNAITAAHQTFAWSNDAPGRAGVHCVIIQFQPVKAAPIKRRLFTYANVKSAPTEQEARYINAYLLDGPAVIVRKQRKPMVAGVNQLVYGNKPADGGHLILHTEAELNEFLADEPGAKKFIKKLLDAQDFLKGQTRWCLWLVDAEPSELRKLPRVLERVQKVKQVREESKSPIIRKFASIPALFVQRPHVDTTYLVVPAHTSERREYIPFGYMDGETVINNALFMVPEADLFTFGVMTSRAHMDWMRLTSGRLESRYRYNKELTYNTFPWPDRRTLAAKQVQAIEAAAQAVLDARAKHPNSTLADLYDPNLMPLDLRKAHDALDRAVEACYRKAAFKSEAERVAFLLDEYQKLAPTLLTPAAKPAKKRIRKAAAD